MKKSLCVFAACFLSSLLLRAQTPEAAPAEAAATPQETSAPSQPPAEAVDLQQKSLFWMPMASLLLPGLGQGADGHIGKSVFFAGYAIAGYSLLADADYKIYEFDNSPSLKFNYYRDLLDQETVAGAMILHAGFLSSYDTFQNRLAAYQAQGKFEFVPKDQSLDSILTAPLHFGYLGRWTTWLPMLTGIGIAYANLIQSPRPLQFRSRTSDIATGTYIGYEAGTGEEAFFRGYLFPLLYEQFNHSWTANATQGLIFGYAHTQFNQPYFQILAGWYFGWLTERNGFDVRESAFIHAWWDFFIENADLLRQRSFTQDFHIRLPVMTFTF